MDIVSLRDLALIDLQVIEEWYAQINGAIYASRYGPKRFNGRDTNKIGEYVWFIIKVNEVDCGIIWLEKEEKINDIAILGIMIGKIEYLGKGIGKNAISLAIEKSRQKLNFNIVCLNVRKENTRAIRCYTKYGFYIKGEGVKVLNNGQKIEFLKMTLDLDKLVEL